MNQKDAKELIKEVKTLYPNPVSSDKDNLQANCYCVAGAFCTFCTGRVYRFPLPETIAGVIHDRLHVPVSLKKVIELLDLNDESKFELAWNKLEEILTTE